MAGRCPRLKPGEEPEFHIHAEAAIAAGLDLQLTQQQRLFLYMPFQHSEVLADQERSLILFTALGDEDFQNNVEDVNAMVDSLIG